MEATRVLDWDTAAADTAYRAKVEEAEARQRLLLEQRAREVGHCSACPAFNCPLLPIVILLEQLGLRGAVCHHERPLPAQGPVTAHLLGVSEAPCMLVAQQRMGLETPADASQGPSNMLDMAR